MPSAAALLAPRRRHAPSVLRGSLAGDPPGGRDARGASSPGGAEPTRSSRGPFAVSSEFRLLVVDDDRLMTDLLPKKLARAMREEVRILTAANALEAQRMIEREQPHAVLSDYNLREAWTGLDVLRHAQQHAPSCARILFSGHTRREIGRALDDAPIDRYLEKPMRLDELVPSILAALQESTGVDLRREG